MQYYVTKKLNILTWISIHCYYKFQVQVHPVVFFVICWDDLLYVRTQHITLSMPTQHNGRFKILVRFFHTICKKTAEPISERLIWSDGWLYNNKMCWLWKQKLVLMSTGTWSFKCWWMIIQARIFSSVFLI